MENPAGSDAPTPYTPDMLSPAETEECLSVPTSTEKGGLPEVSKPAVTSQPTKK